jgi:hypothetical protein
MFLFKLSEDVLKRVLIIGWIEIIPVLGPKTLLEALEQRVQVIVTLMLKRALSPLEGPNLLTKADVFRRQMGCI